MKTAPLPAPRPAPDPLDDECLPLIDGEFADAWTVTSDPARTGMLRARLMERVVRSARDSRAFVTVRLRDTVAEHGGQGAEVRLLYEAATRQALRRGEPQRVRLIELAAGGRWVPDEPTRSRHTEWLVLAGTLQWGELALRERDFVAAAPGLTPVSLTSADGASIYLRESADGPVESGQPVCVRDADARWDDFAPGIRRRVLWSGAGQAAMLYHAAPGAAVPRHGHGHDEECLMLDGEVFLDDLLLRRGDYQLAPAGTLHGGVQTDTGGVLFAHGDLDLDVRAD